MDFIVQNNCYVPVTKKKKTNTSFSGLSFKNLCNLKYGQHVNTKFVKFHTISCTPRYPRVGSCWCSLLDTPCQMASIKLVMTEAVRE